MSKAAHAGRFFLLYVFNEMANDFHSRGNHVIDDLNQNMKLIQL
ncbi:hypothetical protein [Peribacillus sp. SCS-155]